MKKIIAIACMAWIALAGAWADNISAGDITLPAGETKTVNISLTNTESNLVSFQIDLTLPEGISINKAGCSLSNRISDPDQELAIGKQGDNVYRIASTSFALTPISGTSGTLFTLSLTASANSQGGTATLSNIRFFTSNSERVTMSDATFRIATLTEQSLSLASLPLMTYGDDAYTLPETTTQGLTLTWDSGNAAVATVSGNVLSMNGAGTTIITATQAGNDSYLPFSREFTLTVKKACQTLELESLPKMTYGDAPYTLPETTIWTKPVEVVDAVIDYSNYSGFPFYVMGYVPEWVNGVMTDQGGNYTYATINNEQGLSSDVTVTTHSGVEYYRLPSSDTWHTYYLADGIRTEFDESYTVKAMVRASEVCTINVNMGWGWGEGQQKSASVSIGTEWTEIEWEYSEIGGTSCNLIAQSNTTAQIEWKWVKVSHDQKEQSSTIWQEWLTSDGKPVVVETTPADIPTWMGNAETPWPNPNVAYNDQTQNYLICAWSRTNAGDPVPSSIETVDGNKVFVVHATACANPDDDASTWDNQFWIQSPKAWKAGETVKIHFRYKASKEVSSTDTRIDHQNPFDYLIWHAIGNIAFTTEWQEFDGTMTFADDMAEGWSIAFNLNSVVKDAVDFYFDDLSWQSMKLDEGYFVAGSNPQEGIEYDFDNAIQFVEGVNVEGSPCFIATVGTNNEPVSQIMISTVRGNDAAFKGKTLKPVGTITNNPNNWLDCQTSSLAKIDLPRSGMWNIYLKPDYMSIAFERINGEAIEINPNPTEIVVNALERDDMADGYDWDGTIIVNEEEGGTGQPWDNQFWIVANRTLSAGEFVTVKFKYKADKPAKTSTMSFEEPGAYLHWAAIGDVNFTEDWQDFEKTFTVASEANGMKSIAFNLAEIREANNYYIKDVIWMTEDGTESLIAQEGQTNSDGSDIFVSKVVGGNIVPAMTSVNGVVNSRRAPYVANKLAGQRVTKGFLPQGLPLTWTSSDASIATISGNVLTIKGAGTATIRAKQTGNKNYHPFSKEYTLTVDKAALTITANDCSKVEGEENPELTVSYEGFKYDDDASVLAQQPTVTTTATVDSPIGTYPITVSGAEASNYEITYVEGTLTVEEAPLEPTDISQIDNVIYMEPQEVPIGSRGTLSFKMKNNAPIRGFQFDLYLPEGMTVATSSNGKVEASLNATKLPEGDSHLLTASIQDGFVRFLCSSQYDENFATGDDIMMTLKVNVSEDMTEGEYPIELKTVKLSETDVENYYLTELVRSKVIVGSYLLGDVNADGVVDISDYISIANYIHGYSTNNFIFKAGDVNGDGEVDISDYISVANIIHTGSPSGNSQAGAKAAVFMTEESQELDPE